MTTTRFEETARKMDRFIECEGVFAVWEMIASKKGLSAPNRESFKTLEQCENAANAFYAWLVDKGLATPDVLGKINFLLNSGETEKLDPKVVQVLQARGKVQTAGYTQTTSKIGILAAPKHRY